MEDLKIVLMMIWVLILVTLIWAIQKFPDKQIKYYWHRFIYFLQWLNRKIRLWYEDLWK